MALYRFKKGDSYELRRYRVAAWRAFAHRPEVSSSRRTFGGSSYPRDSSDPGTDLEHVASPWSPELPQAHIGRLDQHPTKAGACSGYVRGD